MRSRQTSNTRFPLAERLESRTLLATQLPPGFNESIYVQDSTPTHLVLGQLTAMDFAPDGRLFVLEKKGNVKIIENGQVNPTPFFSVPVDGISERGLDGIVLDPDFVSNGFVYLYYTTFDPVNPNQVPNAAKNRLVRVTADPANPNVALADSMVVLLDGIASDTGIHNGGSLHFGPDGMLYVGTGESGTPAYANDLTSLNGKILRLDVANYPNSIVPSDNPFVSTPGARPEIYAYGFRNPFTAAFDPVTGKFLVNDVGGTEFEEINELTAGGYYGWPEAEGVSDTPPDAINPIYSYAHLGLNGTGVVDSAISGGTFYRGSNFPEEYQGKYFFADYTRHFIRVLDPATNQAVDFIEPTLRDLIDLDVNPVDGKLYALGYQFRVLVYDFGNLPSTVISDVTADTAGGKLPLTVNFTANATGEGALTYTWDFGDGTAPTVAGAVTAHTYTTAGTYPVRVAVTSAASEPVISDPITVYAGNEPAKIKIRATKTYTAGQAVTFSATAKDPEDGALDPNTFDFQVVFHHDTHTHPFLDDLNDRPGDAFTVANPLGENAANQWYRIHVTVADAGGQPATAFVDVHPRTGKATLRTNVPGLTLKLDEAPSVEPIEFEGVANALRTIEAPAEQELNGIRYAFEKWSDRGEARHALPTPKGRKTFTAFYKAVGPAEVSVSAANLKLPETLAPGARGPSGRVTVLNSGAIAVDGTADVALVASLDGLADPSDVDLTVLTGVAVRLKDGKARTYKLRVDTVPNTLPEGQYQILAVIRNIVGIEDTDATNNVRVGTTDGPVQIGPLAAGLAKDAAGDAMKSDLM